MTIYYRDNIGIVGETLSDGESVDFCDGYAYFTFEGYDGGEPIDRKIPLSALVRIER